MRYRYGTLSGTRRSGMIRRCTQQAAMILCVGLLSSGSVCAMTVGTGAGPDLAVEPVQGKPADVKPADIKQAEDQKGPLCITRKLEEGQEQPLIEPSETYWDKDGGEYRLDHWEVVTIPGHTVQRHLEKQVVYAGVEGAEGLPESISVDEEVSGNPAQGNLQICRSQVLKEEWHDGFSAPVTFHSYGADEYHTGGLVIQGEDILGSSVAMGGDFLNVMGLSPAEYRILSMEWSGEPYEDQDGNLCRQAMVSGQKLLRDYEITYEGEVSSVEPETYELQMIYRPVIHIEETAEAPAEEAVQEAQAGLPAAEESSLWYWVRSGFVITVGAGLMGIAVGLITLFLLWYRQNRREHSRRYLPQIKG